MTVKYLKVDAEDGEHIGIIAKGENFTQRLTTMLEEHYCVKLSLGYVGKSKARFLDVDESSSFLVNFTETWMY